MSQNELSRISGIPQSTISGIERERINVGVERAKQLGRARLSDPSSNQYVVLALRGPQLMGFAWVCGGEDETWGSFLDNLHVRPGNQGDGVGTTLMGNVAAWCRENYPGRGLYLWVLEQNHGAQRFYRRLGACDRGGEVSAAPGGGQIHGRRYAWADLADFPPA